MKRTITQIEAYIADVNARFLRSGAVRASEITLDEAIATLGASITDLRHDGLSSKEAALLLIDTALDMELVS